VNGSNPKPKLFMFGWPSYLGGADTKLAHLLGLLTVTAKSLSK
jgi:hypothetical protein